MTDGRAKEARILVGGEQGVDDCAIEHVGGQSVGVTGLGAVALGRTAGVIATGRNETCRTRAREALAAVVADDESGEQVVRGVGGALGGVLTALVEDHLCGVEQLLLNESGMAAVAPPVTVANLAEVDPTAQHR